MSETERTPTPWRIWQDGNGRLHIGPSSNCYVAALNHPPTWTMQGNADFIVEAVNSHASLTAERDRLREALTNSVSLLDQYFSTFGEISGSNQADIEDYRAALSTEGSKP